MYLRECKGGVSGWGYAGWAVNYAADVNLSEDVTSTPEMFSPVFSQYMVLDLMAARYAPASDNTTIWICR